MSVLVAGLALTLASCGGGSDERTEPGAPTATSDAPTATASPIPEPSPSRTPPASPAPPTLESRRALPFSAHAIATDVEGDVYLTGSQEVGPAEPWGRTQAMVLERSDPDGGREWVRRWTSSDEWYRNATGFDVAVAPDGDPVYVAGEITDESGENRAVQVWAYSPEGRLRWSRATGGMAFGAAAAASDTGVVVGGYGWVGAFDEDGTELWTSDFEEAPGEHCDEVADLAIGNSGAIYAVGALDLTPSCNDTEGAPYRDADIVIQKRSASGKILWSRAFTDPGAPDNDEALAVDVADGAIFVTGHEDGRAWLVRLTPQGRTTRTDRWGRQGSGTFGVDVSASPWGAVYAVGDRRPPDAEGTLSLRRYTPDGDLVWRWSHALRGGADVAGIAVSAYDAVYVLTVDCETRCPLWRFPA